MIKHSTKISKKGKKNLQQISAKAVIRRYGSDSYKYCEKNRFTIVEGELTYGSEGVDRIVFRYCPMKWSDSEKRLTAREREKVFRAVGEHLDKGKILWKFSDFGIEDWVPPE
jgi:hypothetical protein